MSRWAAITFGRDVDRGAAALAVVRHLRERGLAVAGFLQLKLPEVTPETIELVQLGGQGRVRLGVRAGRPPDGTSCSFAFDAEAFAAGRSWLEAGAPSADVLLLHELGKLELEGQGHTAALTWALGRPGGQPVVFCARAERLGGLVERFQLDGDPVAYLEHHSPAADPARFAAELAAAASRWRTG